MSTPLIKCLDEIVEPPEYVEPPGYVEPPELCDIHDRPKLRLRTKQHRTAAKGGRLVGPRLTIAQPIVRRVNSEPAKIGESRSALQRERRADIPTLLNMLAIASFREDSDSGSDPDAGADGERSSVLCFDVKRKGPRALARERRARKMSERKKADSV